MTLAYYTTPLSDNIEETPEGFLICRDAVIARTGWQTYKVNELPEKSAADLGIDVSNPHASIDLYRDEGDVFDPDTLSSFEGKPVTDNHPPDFVAPETFAQYARGHVQNVRKGSEALESGDWPIIADIHITAEPLLSKVKNRMVRELSCGYDYGIRRSGDKVLQVSIIGNHVAVVPKGRAGSEARIQDSAPTDALVDVSAVAAPEQPPPKPVVKEQKPVTNILRHLLGLGFKEYAKDAEPEKLAEAAAAMNEKPPAAEDTRATDKMAKDKRMHDALQRMLDGPGCEEGSEMAVDKGAHDADMEALKGMLDQFFSEEEQEPEHAADEEEAPEGEGSGEETEPGGEEEVTDRAHAADGAMTMLKVLRPFVARSKDSALHTAFNTALASVKKGSKASTGSYGGFAARARSRDAAPRKGTTARVADSAVKKDPMVILQESYNAAHKGGK